MRLTTDIRRRGGFGDSRPRSGSERGASLVLVSGALVAFVAIAALAVDYGQLVVQRRAMVTATDAAALAGATIMAEGGDGTTACAEARNYLTTNAPQHDSSTFACDATTRPGIVEVEAAHNVPYGFATVIGMSSGTAHSSSAAEYMRSLQAGLRPFLLCQTYTQAFEDWITGAVGSPPTIRFSMGDNLDDCVIDGGDGNWAIADFDGGGNPLSDVRNWVQNGYDGPLESCADVTCPPDPTTCPVDAAACVDGDPGVPSNSMAGELDSIMGNGTIISLAVVREVTTGSGNNLSARIDRFVFAELVGYNVKGNSADRWLEFRFLNDDDPVVDVDAGVRICGAVLTECP